MRFNIAKAGGPEQGGPEVVAEISALARRSGEINQRSGVSVRVSIANDETLRP